MSDWQDGYEAGYKAGVYAGREPFLSVVDGKKKYENPLIKDRRGKIPPRLTPTRKASAYSKRYGKAFKRLAPKYKKKSGGWKKNGFRLCAAAARKAAKK
jgi:hypothetical protein